MNIEKMISEAMPSINAAITIQKKLNETAVMERKRTAPPKKSPLLESMVESVDKGEMPSLLVFHSAANFSYNTHALRIYNMMKAGDLDSLRAKSIHGINTYAKALRRYRGLCIRYLEEQK